MSQSPTQGQFVWHELMTTDPAAAISFYSHVVGWTTQVWGGEGGGFDYKMWVGSQGPLGGVMPLHGEMASAGVPPHWTCNVTVDDLEASLAKVQALGGKILNGPNAMPGVGRFAVIADPQGASLVLFKPEGDMKPMPAEVPGHFAWSELYSDDHVAGFRFYRALFGWEKIGSVDMGPMGEYLLFGHGEPAVGGMMTKSPDMPIPSVWGYYIHVGDFDAALERARERGAQVLNGPMEVPGGNRVVNLLDPQGAAFSLHGA